MSHCEEHAKLNTGEEDHCLHDSRGPGKLRRRVCCWCGDLFMPDGDGPHGEYATKDPCSEVADLKARLRFLRRSDLDYGYYSFDEVQRVTDLRRKNWRKP